MYLEDRQRYNPPVTSNSMTPSIMTLAPPPSPVPLPVSSSSILPSQPKFNYNLDNKNDLNSHVTKNPRRLIERGNSDLSQRLKKKVKLCYSLETRVSEQLRRSAERDSYLCPSIHIESENQVDFQNTLHTSVGACSDASTDMECLVTSEGETDSCPEESNVTHFLTDSDCDVSTITVTLPEMLASSRNQVKDLKT
ncbi:uncharacterized protein LOC143246791 [Tachypleus tridentatus]